MTLTDEDRAAIESLCGPGNVPQTARREAIYLAGLHAGMERAAKVCDEWIGVIGDGSYVAERLGQEIREAAK